MKVIKLKANGVERVLDGQTGMTFVVDHETQGVKGTVAHVRDYRNFVWSANGGLGRPFQIWSLAADQYEVISN